MKEKKIYASIAGLTALLLLSSNSAIADIYSYCEGDGDERVCNFTNVKPADSRYKMILKSRKTQPGGGNVASASPQPRPVNPNAPINPAAFTSLINRAANTYSLDPALVRAVIHTESNFNPNVCSRKGACGLMQLMPGTAKRYGVANVYDPEQNILGGTRYLRDLLKMFNQNKHMALAAYNAGENSVLRHGGIPPYRETVDYVTKVLFLHKRYQNHGIAMNNSPVNG